jgi:glycosyltransferase involved in cell wall biosynthesis
MMDIVFDFTSSPVGGGLRRLEAYAEYFNTSGLKTLFLVHPKVAERISCYKGIAIEPVTRTGFAKATGDVGYLRAIGKRERPRWLFSYGIPVHARVADKCWFHISNVLPLYLAQVTLNLKLRMMMIAFSWWIRCRAKNCDVVSAESLFSISRYDAVTKTSGQRVLLNNGLPERLFVGEDRNDAARVTRGNYAVAVGSASYKRIDRTYEAFLGIKNELGVERLKIVGDSAHIPIAIRKANDVDIIRCLNDDAEYSGLISRSLVFISTSETENSSNAVIEGLFLSERALLSNIPSHLEMLARERIQKRIIGSQHLVLADKSSIDIKNVPTWRDSIEKMLVEMQF